MDNLLRLESIFSFHRFVLKNWLVRKLVKTSLRKRVLSLFVAFVYMCLRKMKCKKVDIYCERNEHNTKILEDLKNMLESYSPTLYMPSTFLAMAVSGRKISSFKCYMRQMIQLPDKEEVSLDWMPKNQKALPDNTPIVVLVPGLTNDSRDVYTRTFIEYAVQYGFRACIFNRRGYACMPFRKEDPDPITWNKWDDLDFIVKELKTEYPAANLYLAGASMGANHIQLYAGLKGKNKESIPVKALGCISSPFCLTAGTKNANGQTLVRKVLTHQLVTTVTEHLHEQKFVEAIERRGIDLEHALQSTSTDEFNERFSLAFTPYGSLAEYKQAVSGKDLVRHIQIPVLSVNSQNDDIVPFSAIPFEEIAANPRFIEVVTSGGGHLEYFTSWKMRRWAFDLVLQYFSNLEQGSNKPADRPHPIIAGSVSL